MTTTNQEISAARKILEGTAPAAIQPDGDAEPVAEVKPTFEGRTWIHWRGKPEVGMKLYTHPAAPVQAAPDAAMPLHAGENTLYHQWAATENYGDQWPGWSARARLAAPAAPVQAAPDGMPTYEEVAADLKTARATIRIMDQNKAAYLARNAELEAVQAAPVGMQKAMDADPMGWTKREQECFKAGQAAPEVKASEFPPLHDEWVIAVRKSEHFCPSELSSPDRWKWKAQFLRNLLSARSPVAAPQPDVVGMEVSMDVSTGDEDGTNRVFGRVEGLQAGTDGKAMILAVEESRNFAAPESAEPSLVRACQLLIEYCDANPPMGDSLWSLRQIRAILATSSAAKGASDGN